MMRYKWLNAIYSKIAEWGKNLSEIALHYMEYDMDYVGSKNNLSEEKREQEEKKC